MPNKGDIKTFPQCLASYETFTGLEVIFSEEAYKYKMEFCQLWVYRNVSSLTIHVPVQKNKNKIIHWKECIVESKRHLLYYHANKLVYYACSRTIRAHHPHFGI